jgi:hypothetical protein
VAGFVARVCCAPKGGRVWCAPKAAGFGAHPRRQGLVRTQGGRVCCAPKAAGFGAHPRRQGLLRTQGGRVCCAPRSNMPGSGRGTNRAPHRQKMPQGDRPVHHGSPADYWICPIKVPGTFAVPTVCHTLYRKYLQSSTSGRPVDRKVPAFFEPFIPRFQRGHNRPDTAQPSKNIPCLPQTIVAIARID